MDLTCLHIPQFAAWALSQRWHLDESTSSNGSQRPIIVCQGGRVLSFIDERISHRGIRLGDPVDRARRLAPGAQFLLRDPDVERALWESILGRLYQLTPQIQPIPDPLRPVPRKPARRKERKKRGTDANDLFASVGDPELTETDDSVGLWDNGAWAILQGPYADGIEALATEWGAQVGRGHRRSWAMLAAAYSKPGQITTVPEPMIAQFLRQAPIELLQRLCFTGELVERLHLFGLKAIGHIFGLTKRQLMAQFIDEGRRLFDLLHPDDMEPPVSNYDRRILQAEYEFDWPVFEPGDLQPVLRRLLKDLLEGMQGLSTRHLEVRLHHRRRDDRFAHRILKDPTRSLQTLGTVGETLLMQALTANSGARRAPTGRSVDRVSVTMSGLTRVMSQQAELFRQRPELKPVVLRVESRFPGKLVRPVHAHADPFFPEEEYRLVPIAV
ncbi:MAG: hypothetical protein HOM68_23095 [Gemmatimonadetes bacterium]|nr:hypothetical protein [Gemmatimonadota bacterium]MBT4612319.1 hypothetical protein [Gemmatimonadota bacterium]MBT5059450.1 hypothetical protein [Gemmatimonadota bacterium]MBT5146538.1 hypothetical protein [Gemmatimonadota bacterium]MBT5591459.1 hypothetical protein [Gemmatimonadota bacterium]